MSLPRVATSIYAIFLACFCMLEASNLMAAPENGPFIVVIGAPAAGKSESSEMISEMYNIPSIDVRQELLEAVELEARQSGSVYSLRNSTRHAVQNNRRKAKKAALDKLEAGELVSDDSLNALVASNIFDPKSSGGFVLDGYPMTVAQAEFLDSIVEVKQMVPLKVLYLNVPDEVALQRMKERGRVDDKYGFAEKRLESFRSMIGPLLDYYGEEAVIEIDGTQSQSDIAAAISKFIEG